MVPNRESYTASDIGKTIATDDYYYTEYEEGIYVGYRYFETFDVDVKYPFGYGLSYTTFSYDVNSVKAVDDKVVVSVTVKNTGEKKGREIVQVYYGAPDGTLENPTKELAAYAKTDELNPDKSQTLTISYNIEDMASFLTSSASYILESGNYRVYVGTSVKDVETFNNVYSVSTTRVVKTCSNMEFENTSDVTLLSKDDPTGTYPTHPGKEYDSDYAETYIRSDGGGGTNAEEITDEMIIAAQNISGVVASYSLEDVYNGTAPIDTFGDQMNPIELAAMLVGDGAGYGSDFTYLGSYSQNAVGAGSTPTISRLGIPTANFADGPAGISVGEDPTSWPVGLNQAMSWDDELMEELQVKFILKDFRLL